MPSPPHERRAFTYTTAPADYDWFGSATVRVVGHDKRGRPIRLVSSDPKHVQSQRERYMSGLHMAVDDAEWEKLVKYHLVTLQKNPCAPCAVLSGSPTFSPNPIGGGLITAALLAAAGVGAWLIFRKEPEKKSCASSDMIGAFSKYMGYVVYASPGLPKEGSPALAAIVKEPKAKLYNEQDCQFHKRVGASWVVDQATNAELAAFTGKIDSLAGHPHPFVGLTIPR